MSKHKSTPTGRKAPKPSPRKTTDSGCDPYSRVEATDAQRFARVARGDYDHLFMDSEMKMKPPR